MFKLEHSISVGVRIRISSTALILSVMFFFQHRVTLLMISSMNLHFSVVLSVLRCNMLTFSMNGFILLISSIGIGNSFESIVVRAPSLGNGGKTVLPRVLEGFISVGASTDCYGDKTAQLLDQHQYIPHNVVIS